MRIIEVEPTPHLEILLRRVTLLYHKEIPQATDAKVCRYMRPRLALSAGNFFFAASSTLSIYIFIPYLSTFMSEKVAGLVIAAGSAVSFALFPLAPRFVRRFGARQMAVAIASIEAISLLLLALYPGAYSGIFFIAIVAAIQPLLSYQLDLLLEATVDQEGTTGRVRTMFTTAWNAASVGAPLLMGILLTDASLYGNVFLVSAAMLMPFIALFTLYRIPQQPPPTVAAFKETLRCIVRDRDTNAVMIGHLLLYLFFVWAPLYVPIYLHAHLGIPWSTLGWMFSLMLIPYLLVEYPAGYIADMWLGDKELMAAGFLIGGGSIAAIAFFTPTTPIPLIVAVLITSRIGAALMESMTEGHFFRRVSQDDENSVSVFRSLWPLADVLAPLTGSILLVLGGFSALFLVAGGTIAIVGLFSALRTVDFTPQADTDRRVP